MIKFWSAVYVFFTSIAYFYLLTAANKLYEDKHIALPVLCAIVVFLAFLISFFKDKITEKEWDKKLKDKDSEIAALKAIVSKKDVVIHELRSTFFDNVLTAQGKTPEEFVVAQYALARRWNKDPVVNNLDSASSVSSLGVAQDEALSSYFSIQNATHRSSSPDP
ncbi:hypothetical protein H8S66_22105 [Pseudomonas lurida]|uniref:hypothetical protein n=1 Tax=Pseudomonas lurida TaxID=244566 RepID=UPI0016545BDF|nr:hypothetical protein [Pseudomonas lurida]MBC3925583.1 hypothetical protein [Pseudomonas lurida]